MIIFHRGTVCRRQYDLLPRLSRCRIYYLQRVIVQPLRAERIIVKKCHLILCANKFNTLYGNGYVYVTFSRSNQLLSFHFGIDLICTHHVPFLPSKNERYESKLDTIISWPRTSKFGTLLIIPLMLVCGDPISVYSSVFLFDFSFA